MTDDKWPHAIKATVTSGTGPVQTPVTREELAHIELARRDAIKTTREDRAAAGEAIKEALRVCGITLRVHGNELLDVGDSLLRSKWFAAFTVLHPAPVADNCNCGWGGAHDPDNPRCRKNALAPVPAPWPEAGGGCTCWVNPKPFTHYGAVEPGDALEPNPDCPMHFPTEQVKLDPKPWVCQTAPHWRAKEQVADCDTFSPRGAFGYSTNLADYSPKEGPNE